MKILRIITIIFVSISSARLASAETLIMPQELVELAQEHGYSQVTDFYNERFGAAIGPPYVYGYLEGPVANSAAFWVKPKGKKSKTIRGKDYPIKSVLLIMARERSSLKPKLFDKIEHINPPAGLSIYKNRNTTLDGFVFMDNPQEKVPENVKFTKNAIKSSDGDGVEEIFYNYKSRWLIRLWH